MLVSSSETLGTNFPTTLSQTVTRLFAGSLSPSKACRQFDGYLIQISESGCFLLNYRMMIKLKAHSPETPP